MAIAIISPKQKVTLASGKEIDVTLIDSDESLLEYMSKLDKKGSYPLALPTVATPEQLALPASKFQVGDTRAFDTERKMIAYVEYGGRAPYAPPITSIQVFNRNDACKSCAAILQQHFKGKNEVIHIYGNEYTKY